MIRFGGPVDIIMTAEGHLLFSISCSVFAKKAELTSVLKHGDWWHIVSSAMLTCLLPDIDHQQSLLGQRLKLISRPVAMAFGHRGFTHSLLAVFVVLTFFYKVSESWIIPADAVQGMIIGYVSHIFADMLTTAGVPLLWPCRWRFRLPLLAIKKGNQLERVLCTVLFAWAVCGGVPQTMLENGAVRWSSQMLNLLQGQFDNFINYQLNH